MINNLRGLVSNETLLAQLPFITDVEAEQEKVSKETEETVIYDFNKEDDE